MALYQPGGSGGDTPPAWSWQQAFEPEAQAAIRRSAAELARDQGAFVWQLHSDVSSLIPESALPPGFDMRAFCERMAQAMLWLALADPSRRMAIEALRQLGSQNWYEGFPDSQYPSVAHALIQTVHYLGANSWTTSTGSSWISFFVWIQPYLLEGAQDSAAREAAARHAAVRETAPQRAAAEREAARAAALSRDRRSGQANVTHNADFNRVRPFLDDSSEPDDLGSAQIMLSTARTPHRNRP